MAGTKKGQISLLFEELEPRLLFSADALDALAIGAVEKEALVFLIPPVSAATIILESADTEIMPIANKAMQADLGDCPRIGISESALTCEYCFFK